MSSLITVISSTNRPGSASLAVSRAYVHQLQQLGQPAGLLSLETLPADFLKSDLYGKRSDEMRQIIETHIEGADKLVFVIPEYNGSYPGILKLFLDGLPPRLLRDKKAGIIGVSDGRAGNLRGQEHLTGVLHYLKVHVHYAKPKLSSIEEALGKNGEITRDETIRQLAEHARLMIEF